MTTNGKEYAREYMRKYRRERGDSMTFGVTWDGKDVYPNESLTAFRIESYLSRRDDMESVAVPAIYINAKW